MPAMHDNHFLALPVSFYDSNIIVHMEVHYTRGTVEAKMEDLIIIIFACINIYP